MLTLILIALYLAFIYGMYKGEQENEELSKQKRETQQKINSAYSTLER
jgi:type II secretory pathway component PulJ